MRVVGGTWKGYPLEAPPTGAVTRPTTDRAREAIMSMVLSYFDLDLTGKTVLDAFAGSGAMGIEYLSRGASQVAFCDKDRGAAARVKKNLRSVNAAPASYNVYCNDVFKLVETPTIIGAPFDIVTLDPPYKNPKEEVEALLGSLLNNNMLKPGALVVFEHGKGSYTLDISGFEPLKQKKYGTCFVDTYKVE